LAFKHSVFWLYKLLIYSKLMKNYINAALFAVAIVISSIILGKAFIDRNKAENVISVTGLGKSDFTSDLIVWEGLFSNDNYDLKSAYAQLESDKQIVSSYLKSKGVAEKTIVFTAVTTTRNTKPNYSPDGKYLGEVFTGFNMSQRVELKSTDVERVEQISREITELLNKGISLYSEPPRYYYTKLADLKIKMISEATEDARIRAEQISEKSGSSLGDLQSATMGVFQITGQNSDEEYSWGGTFNTSAKEKTASITMKLTYEVN
jgi:hypothetical protein